MRLLANENFPRAAVEALRARGHDVAWVRTDAPGSSDEQVMATAAAEKRILITFDKDFGELAFRAPRPGVPAIVLFRVPPTSKTRVADIAVSVLESRTDWDGQFAVITEQRVRLRPLR